MPTSRFIGWFGATRYEAEGDGTVVFGSWAVERDGIGTTSTDGVVLKNLTPASVGAQQYSPRLRFEGQGWKTNATAASQSLSAAMEIQPKQGASAPTFDWVVLKSTNGGAYGDLVRLDSTARLYAGYSAAGSFTAGYANTLFGSQAGEALDVNLVDGAWANTLIGSRAGLAITKGQNNTVVGEAAMTTLTTGVQNTSIGAGAAQALTGSSSTFVGFKAGLRMSGSSNIFIGALSGGQGDAGVGASNTSVGESSMFALTSGDANVAFGQEALKALTTGTLNTAIGRRSLLSLVSGSNNVALGFSAGRYETGSSAFYVDALDRTNTAGDKAGALLYGTFHATPGSQTLKINAGTITMGLLPTVDPAVAGVLWNDTGTLKVSAG